MAPNRLARALGKLHDAITHSRVETVLGPLRLFSNAMRPNLQTLLECFAALSSRQAEFGAPERALLKALDLEMLVESAWWSRLITATTRSTMPEELAAALLELCARLQVVTGGFTALSALLEGAPGAADDDETALVLTLPGLEGEPPALARIAGTIEAVNQLWTVAEELTGQRGPLHLLAMEPGPVVALYSNGAAEPLGELRALLVSVWDQTARLPNVPPERHAALVPEMLPVMDRIGRGGRADALRVRNTVENGVRRLLQVDCFLRGMPSASAERVSPAPQTPQPPPPALAVAPEQLVAEPAPAHYLSEEDMSHLAAVIAEERRQLGQSEPGRRLWHGTGAPHTT